MLTRRFCETSKAGVGLIGRIGPIGQKGPKGRKAMEGMKDTIYRQLVGWIAVSGIQNVDLGAESLMGGERDAGVGGFAGLELLAGGMGR